MTIYCHETFALEKQISHNLCNNIVFNALNKHMIWIFVRIASLGDSNKYPNDMFYEEIRTKQDLSYISICSLSILYNSKVIVMATWWEHILL